MTGKNTLQESWEIALDLDVDDINHDNDFFDFDGDPVRAIRLVEVAGQRRLGLDAETVFRYPDILEMLVDSERVPTAFRICLGSSILMTA